MHRYEIARKIHRRAHLKGSFKLRSGAMSDTYFDKYRFESDPKLLRGIAEAFVRAHLSVVQGPAPDALAGLELGGIPIAVMLSQVTGIPTVFVRKAAKDYGTCQIVEGDFVEGRRLLLVEDVVTSGGQIVESAEKLRGLGATVEHAIAVIDRSPKGGLKLDRAGITLWSLFQASELEAAAIVHVGTTEGNLCGDEGPFWVSDRLEYQEVTCPKCQEAIVLNLAKDAAKVLAPKVSWGKLQDRDRTGLLAIAREQLSFDP